MQETSLERVYEFLDHVEGKNIMPKNTVVGRRVACKTVFEVLSDEEKNLDYVNGHLDVILARFVNKSKTDFKGATQEVYMSRVKSTLEDFSEWSSSPADWERSVASGRIKSSKSTKESAGTSKKNNTASEQKGSTGKQQSEFQQTEDVRILSLPIRGGTQEIKFQIPRDGLTVGELQRIGMLLVPYCKDIHEDAWQETQWPKITLPAKTDSNYRQ